jgi:thioredoxin 1
MTMEIPIIITEGNFENVVKKSELPVLVDFWATWCNPCKMIAPLIEKIAGEYSGRLVVAKVDVDTNPDVASELGIRSIPTLIIFKKGEIAEQIIGVVSEAQLKKTIDKVIGA